MNLFKKNIFLEKEIQQKAIKWVHCSKAEMYVTPKITLQSIFFFFDTFFHKCYQRNFLYVNQL